MRSTLKSGKYSTSELLKNMESEILNSCIEAEVNGSVLDAGVFSRSSQNRSRFENPSDFRVGRPEK